MILLVGSFKCKNRLPYNLFYNDVLDWRERKTLHNPIQSLTVFEILTHLAQKWLVSPTHHLFDAP